MTETKIHICRLKEGEAFHFQGKHFVLTRTGDANQFGPTYVARSDDGTEFRFTPRSTVERSTPNAR